MAPLRAVYPPLFSATWRDAIKGSVELTQIATVRIVNPNISGSVYDADTDTWTDSDQEVYVGKARVQPLRTAAQTYNPGDVTQVQVYLFSLPIAETEGIDFRPDFEATVTVSPLNPALLTYRFVLTEIGDSSNPVERTLLFKSNQETST